MTATRITILSAIALLAGGCAAPASKPAETSAAAPALNQLSAEEQAQGWKLLFDGQTTQGWRVYGQPGPVTGWDVKDGVLNALGVTPDGADIITEAQYQNFELSIEWKVAPGGNSGLFFHVVEDTAQFQHVYDSGPEYQLVDDTGFPDKLEDWQKTAANYAMHVPQNPPVKPAGEWNSTRLVVNGARVEHWLNGQKVLEYELWTPEWEKLKAEGKWKDYPGYGVAKTGHIAIQDHGKQSWFRNIKIRSLPDTQL
jgi:hypothetical protein